MEEEYEGHEKLHVRGRTRVTMMHRHSGEEVRPRRKIGQWIGRILGTLNRANDIFPHQKEEQRS